MLSKNEEIEAWIDANSPFISYMWIRGLVKSAKDNTLHVDYPECPYSAKEILLWAIWNDEESILMTPGGQAIEGQELWQEIAGTPEIDPMTGKRNSDADINGAVKQFGSSVAMDLFKVGLTLGVLSLLFQFLGAKARKMGGA